MGEIMTTATTESVRIVPPAGRDIVYVSDRPTGSTYTVVPHPPTRGNERPTR